MSTQDDLMERASERDLPGMKALVAAGVDVNARNEDGWSALLVAANVGFHEGVAFLCESGADVNVRRNGFNALHLVIQKTANRPINYTVTVTRSGKKVKLTDPDEIRAATGGHPDDEYLECVRVAELLIERGIDLEAKKEGSNQTPLSDAASRGAGEIVDLILKKGGADVDAQDNDGISPLHYASRKGHAHPVRSLLGASASPNVRDGYGFTPLHEAAENGHLDIATALVEAGADCAAALSKAYQSYPAGTTPFDLAKAARKKSVATFLAKRSTR